MRRLRRVACLIALVAALPALALETDQYYAWTRPLTDASDAINAKINADIAEALAEVNARHDFAESSCALVQKHIRRRFSYFIFLKPEVWAANTSTIARVPSTPEEELRFRHAYVYHDTSPLDTIRWMPPSPTILVHGVRIGTDKLSHFFSEGAWLLTYYRTYLKKGLTEDEAVERAVRFGLTTERTVLGGTSSGVMSLGDIEANYQGLQFWKGLCHGADPALERAPEGWRLTRPFDIGAYMSPEWDESWQPNVYTKARWKKVEPMLKPYCPLLDDPEVRAQREAYAARDRATPSEAILREMVRKGELTDPRAFTIDAVCGRPSRDVLAIQPVSGGDGASPAPVPREQVRPGER